MALTGADIFGLGYDQDDKGRFLFPRDVERRKELFPQEVFNHPAKANIFLIEALVEYLTVPGDWILDPFGGTGTLLWATQMGRKVTLIEIEEGFQQLQKEICQDWFGAGGWDGIVHLVEGNCNRLLPIFCNHAIFSPPYAQALGKKSGLVGDTIPDALDELGKYSEHPQNMANLNTFFFAQAMKGVYKGLQQSIPPGGMMAVIIKDITRGDERVFLSKDCIREATKVGFEMTEWFKWVPPGSVFTKIMKAKGANTIEDEDIILFRRK